MTTQHIPAGSPLAIKAMSAALFTKMARQPTFRSRNTGPAPKEGQAVAKLRRTVTSAGMPFVEIKDLSKGAGDRADYQIIDIISGKPVMGDRRLAGRMMTQSFATQEIVINQARGGVDTGGRMTRKRTIYDLRKTGMANLQGWNNNYIDNLLHVHAAGARGQQTGKDWASVPVESDPDFEDIVINEVLPPSYNRRVIAGGATTIASMDSTDALNLEVIDELRTQIDESEYPTQGIKIESGDFNSDDEEPLYVLYVSPRGYNQLRAANTEKDWNNMIAQAVTRASQSKHPLFGNGALYYRGIVIKQRPRAIRFNAGASVKEMDSAGAVSTVTAPVAFDRAILLGAQAAAIAWGSDEQSGFHVAWHEETEDHGNRVEISTSLMLGIKKLQFELDGVKTDHGVWTLDHYNGGQTA